MSDLGERRASWPVLVAGLELAEPGRILESAFLLSVNV